MLEKGTQTLRKENQSRTFLIWKKLEKKKLAETRKTKEEEIQSKIYNS